VAVSSTSQVVVHIYFEQTETRLTAQFEAPDLPGRHSKGDLEVTLYPHDERKISLRSEAENINLHGRLESDSMIVGTMHDGGIPGGSLTLFRQEHPGFCVGMYKFVEPF
jgi:hypothetical protein